MKSVSLPASVAACIAASLAMLQAVCVCPSACGPSVSVRVPACLPVSVRVPACVCLSKWMPVCVCPSACLSVRLVPVCVCPTACLCLSECLPVSVRVSTRLSVRLLACVCPSACLCAACMPVLCACGVVNTQVLYRSFYPPDIYKFFIH